MAQRLITPNVFVIGFDGDVLHRPLELVAHRAEYLETSGSGGRRWALRRALVDDDLQRVEAAGRDVHKLRHRLENVRRSHGDLIVTVRAPLKQTHIDIPRRVCGFDGNPRTDIPAFELDVDGAAKGLPVWVQDSKTNADIGIVILHTFVLLNNGPLFLCAPNTGVLKNQGRQIP